MIPIPSSYLLIAKIGGIGALLLGVYLTGRHQGENAVQADWDRSKAQSIAAQSKLVLEHAKEMDDLRKKQDATNIQVSQEHQEALDAIQQKYESNLAAVRSNGLRIPRTVCNSIGPVTEAASPIGRDGDTSTTIALPDTLASDLLDFAADADRTNEIARSCQSWIIKNGFYNVQ